ncbi:hypothetical protein, partial [Pseudosulfitobacter pseudonitzschiae]|uniref:hypothetical protein n=1 Tax=Pseudosulfitobacter pseudonitzschiae TaxID=1402135 RepID=UPI001CCF85D0
TASTNSCPGTGSPKKPETAASPDAYAPDQITTSPNGAKDFRACLVSLYLQGGEREMQGCPLWL